MNDSFFLLTEEKQNRIIDSAYQVFAQNEYKKAPMSEIAATGGISKALLFYYFKNKQELYSYIWSLAVKKISEKSCEYKVTETNDFFEMVRRSLLAKCAVMRQHLYLYFFSIKAYYESAPEVKEMIQSDFQMKNKSSEEIIWSKIDTSLFREQVDIKLLYEELIWVSDGYLHRMSACGKIDADLMEADFNKLISQWKKVYYK